MVFAIGLSFVRQGNYALALLSFYTYFAVNVHSCNSFEFISLVVLMIIPTSF